MLPTAALKLGLASVPRTVWNSLYVHRRLTVVSWGRNSEGQAGIEESTIVTRPTPILGLTDVVKLAAGRLSSGALTASGQVLTWGCGRSGKAGHGASHENILAPTVVESLAGRVHATGIAMGDHHALFLDDSGTVWTQGDNRAGQCGLGTPLPVIAQQHRAALIHTLLHGKAAAAKAQQRAPGAQQQQLQQQQQQQEPGSGSVQTSSNSSSSSSSSMDGQESSGAASTREGSGSGGSSSSSSSSSSGGGGRSGRSGRLRMDSSSRSGSGATGRLGMGLGEAGEAGGQELGGSVWGGGRSSSGNGSSSQQQSGAAERERWVARASSRMHQQLRQRFQELQVQQAQQAQRLRSRALPLHPKQQHMQAEADALAALGAHAPTNWQHHSGPAHITLSGAKEWGPASASPLAVLGSGSGLDLEGHCRVAGLLDGQLCTPTRLGRDQHALAIAAHNTHTPDLLGAQIAPVQPSAGIPEVVVSIAASAKFSVAVTEQGDVWTWGLSYDGALGFSSAWSSSPQRVGGALSAVISDNGGAKTAVAGATFCMVLTNNGTAVVWGRVPGGAASTPCSSQEGPAAPALPPSTSSLLNSFVLDSSGGHAQTGARVECGVVPGLPPITQVAAGAEHALLSDGQRVWVVGRTVNERGLVVVEAPWDAPLEVYDSGAAGVRCLAAGLYASALVTRTGDLLLWGKLLDKATSDLLVQREAALKVMRASAAAAQKQPKVTQPAQPAPPSPQPSQPAGLFASPMEALDGPKLHWATEALRHHSVALQAQRHPAPQPHQPPEVQLLDALAAEAPEEREPVWGWPGFGAAWPTVIECGLEGRVVGVALGGWHCLALVQ